MKAGFVASFLILATILWMAPVKADLSTSSSQLPKLQISNTISSSENYSVSINFVGTSVLQNDEIMPNSDGIYELASSFAFTPIVLKFNFTGHTNWNLGNLTHTFTNTTVAYGNQTTTIGQLFIAVNDNLILVQGSKIAEEGFPVSVPFGDHTIAIIYLNYDPQGTIEYATDYVVVRVRRTVGELGDRYTTVETSTDFNHEDIIPPANMVRPVSWREGSFSTGYERRLFYNPTVDAAISSGGDQISTGDEFIFPENVTLSLGMDIAVNSSYGIAGLQVNNQSRTVQGIHFLFDAKGFHLLEGDSLDVSYRDGTNYIGISSFSPYGLWHSEITIPDGIPCSFCNWGVIDWDTDYDKIQDANNESNFIPLDSSFDFVGQMDGVSFLVGIQYFTTVSTTRGGLVFGLETLLMAGVTLPIIAVHRSRREC